jgi:outer membrane protein assembly factor BamB
MMPWLTALLLAAVWPMYQYAPHHNAVFPGSASVSWRHDFGAKINGGLALVNGVLYVESFDGRVSALKAATGKLLWSSQAGGVVMTTPIVADGVVIAGTGTSRVLTQTADRIVWGTAAGDAIVAFDARTGRQRWRYSTVGENMPSPALARIHGKDAIVFANGDDHLRALDVLTGRKLWKESVDGLASMSSAAADGGAVFVIIGGAANSNVHDSVLAIDSQGGRVLWNAPYGNADCSPAVAGHEVFLEASSSQPGPPDRNAFNIVYALNEGTGKLLWSWYSGLGTFTSVGSDEEAIAALAVDGMLYQSIPATDQFVAFEGRTGGVRWTLRTSAPVKMSAVERNGRLYFGDTGSTLYTVNARSGRVLSRRSFPSYFTTSSPVIDGNTLYIANDTALYALPLGTK